MRASQQCCSASDASQSLNEEVGAVDIINVRERREVADLRSDGDESEPCVRQPALDCGLVKETQYDLTGCLTRSERKGS